MGIEAIYRCPNTSKQAPGHKIYPYLLRKLAVTRPKQVWAMDPTYIPTPRGFGYPYGRSPATPLDQQGPGSSTTQHTVENAAERLRVDVAVHADTTTTAKLNRHIAALPAGLRRDRRF